MDETRLLERAISGDESAFRELIEPQRVRLFRHCYRMLGSGPEAEDALQETLLRAWRRLDSYRGNGRFEGWLYRIATHICIDQLRGRGRRIDPVLLAPPTAPGDPISVPEGLVEVVEPVSDDLVGFGIDPALAAESKERISLAFVSALQRLSARQRAALLLHDVLDFSHEEVADVLDASLSAVNSLLYRARHTIATPPSIEPADPDDPEVRALVERYMRAWELADLQLFLSTVSDDVRFSMPPLPQWFRGVDDVASFVESTIFGPSRLHGMAMVLGRANGQPALATYQPVPSGDLQISGLQVLEIVSGNPPRVRAITSFRYPRIAMRCGFPEMLE